MDKDKRKYISLRTKAFRAILAGSLILILTFSAAGLLLHTYVSIRHFKNEAEHLMNSMMAVQDADYIEKIFKETREIYYSMPPELHEEFYQEIEDVHKSFFGSLADEDYNRAKELIAVFQKNAGAVNMMMFFPDPEADNLVFVLDGDTGEYAYPPGGWLKYDDSDKEAVEKDVKAGCLRWSTTYTACRLRQGKKCHSTQVHSLSVPGILCLSILTVCLKQIILKAE